MKKDYLVSVVLPIYNVEKYLDRCIQSIVNQTYKELEIILVDDGSPDDCPKICDQWALKDGRIKSVHKKNSGLGMARNSGIENASGDFICFVDSDDYIDEETIELCLARAINDKTDLVLYGCRNVNSSGNISSELIPHCPKNIYRDDDVQNIFLPKLITPIKGDWGISMSSCFCLYSIDLLRKTNFRFVSEREIISEDVYSLLKLYKNVSSVSIINRAFYNYCINEVSLTHTYRKDRYEKIKHFYLESLKLCNELKYNDDVINAMQGPYLSFTIAAMKMIAKSNGTNKVKLQDLNAIINDNTLQDLLNSNELVIENSKKKILYWLIKNKIVWAIYGLFRMK